MKNLVFSFTLGLLSLAETFAQSVVTVRVPTGACVPSSGIGQSGGNGANGPQESGSSSASKTGDIGTITRVSNH